MLCINCSTGIVVGAADADEGATAGVPLAVDVVAVEATGGKNPSGYLISGSGAPTGIGFIISGVTITISSVFERVLLIDWKNLPKTGISPIKGILERFFVSR
jgi:hypothetical protein